MPLTFVALIYKHPIACPFSFNVSACCWPATICWDVRDWCQTDQKFLGCSEQSSLGRDSGPLAISLRKEFGRKLACKPGRLLLVFFVDKYLDSTVSLLLVPTRPYRCFSEAIFKRPISKCTWCSATTRIVLAATKRTVSSL